MAGTSDGGFVVTWTSDEDDIYGQRYDTDGTAADDEFLVNTITDQGQRESSVTGLSDGGFVVTWTGPDANGVHEGDGQQFLDRGIFAQRYGADGTTVGGEFQIDPPAGGQQTSPSVTALDNGGFVAVWRYGGPLKIGTLSNNLQILRTVMALVYLVKYSMPTLV